MKISVIVPAHNEEDVIQECLDALLNEEYEPKEIIVVNDGSTDCTREIVERYGNKVKLINFDKGHSAAFARNRGAQLATGDILVFVDADEIVTNGFIVNITEDYNKYHFKFSGINVKSKADNIISKCFALERAQFPLKIPKKCSFIKKEDIPSFAFIFERKFFLKIGKYDETIFYWEDGDITERCFETGEKMFFNPNFILYHKEPNTLWETFRQGFYKGKGAIIGYKRGDSNIIDVCKNFLHPILIFFVFPYVILSIIRTTKEFKFSNDLITSIVSNFVVKPIKGFGAAYGVIRNIRGKI